MSHGLATQDFSSEVEKRYAGVRALWAKVIIRAMYDWVIYRDSPKLALRKYAEGAQSWLFGKSDSFNSFENICHMLEISPAVVRKKAMGMTRDQVAKIEHVDRTFGAVGGAYLPDVSLLLSSCRAEEPDLDLELWSEEEQASLPLGA